MKLVEPIRDRDTLTAVKTWLRGRSLRDWALFVTGINFALRIQDLLRAVGYWGENHPIPGIISESRRGSYFFVIWSGERAAVGKLIFGIIL